MLIKSYAAESTQAALKKVRQEMGGDAIVLKSRKVEQPDGTCLMEVTACLEKATTAQSSMVLARADSRRLNPEPKPPDEIDADRDRYESQAIEEVTYASSEQGQPEAEIKTGSLDRLSSLAERLGRMDSTVYRKHSANDSQSWLESARLELTESDLPSSIIESVLDTPDDSDLTEPDYRRRVINRLRGFIAERIAPAFEIKPGDRVVFLGPAGTGKSSVMGKIAAQAVVDKKKVKLVTLDDLKIGAFDEIATYADLLQIEVTDSSATYGGDSDHVLLIDTPAFPTSADKIATLRRRVEAANPTIRVVVISALMRSTDVARFCSMLKELRPTHVIGTMLDLTASHGSLLAAIETTGRPLLYLCDTPGGMGMLSLPKAESMARRLLALEGTHA